MKDYKGVEIEAVKSEVTDEDVENEIKSMARKNSRMVTVEQTGSGRRHGAHRL